MPTTEPKQSHLQEKIMLHAAKLPLVYLFIGIIFISIALLDNIFAFTGWKNIFVISDEIGDVFITLAIATYVYKVFVFFCLRYERLFAEKNKITSLVLANIRKGVRIIYILIAINIVISIAGLQKSYLQFADSLIKITLIISISWIIIQIFYTIEAVFHQYMLDLTHEDHLRAKTVYTKMHIIRNVTTVAIVIITIAAILMSFSSVRKIGISLLASAGFLTAIIGLSAQRTLFSLFSGIQIVLSQPIKMGDIVVIEIESGVVEEITFTHITLKLGDRRRLLVPISYFIEKPFENWSRDGNSLRSSLRMHVDYMMPFEPLRIELDRLLAESTFWDGIAKKIHVNNITEHSVEIRIQVSAANADDLADLQNEVRE